MLEAEPQAKQHHNPEQAAPASALDGTASAQAPGLYVIPPSAGATASEQAYGGPLYDTQPGVTARAETKANPSAEFDRLADGNVHFDKAPDEIMLPQAAQKGMQHEWDASKHGTPGVQEHGGNLVRNHDGKSNYEWRSGTPGNDQMYSPDYEDVGKGQKLVGVGHTHPYASGKENVSFSGEDISSIVDESSPINLLQSGKTQYMIARTAEFETSLKRLDEAGKEKLKHTIEGTWSAAFGRDSGELPDGLYQQRVERAVRVTCATFDLAYYSGQGGTLKHVV